MSSSPVRQKRGDDSGLAVHKGFDSIDQPASSSGLRDTAEEDKTGIGEGNITPEVPYSRIVSDLRHALDHTKQQAASRQASFLNDDDRDPTQNAAINTRSRPMHVRNFENDEEVKGDRGEGSMNKRGIFSDTKQRSSHLAPTSVPVFAGTQRKAHRTFGQSDQVDGDDEGPGRGRGQPFKEQQLHLLKKDHDDGSSVKEESEDAAPRSARVQNEYQPAARKDRQRHKAMTQYQTPEDHRGSSNDEFVTEPSLELQALPQSPTTGPKVPFSSLHQKYDGRAKPATENNSVSKTATKKNHQQDNMFNSGFAAGSHSMSILTGAVASRPAGTHRIEAKGLAKGSQKRLQTGNNVVGQANTVNTHSLKASGAQSASVQHLFGSQDNRNAMPAGSQSSVFSSVHRPNIVNQKSARYSIIDGPLGAGQQATNGSLVPPIGRRLDQVQTRRRRTKNARTMYPMYCYTSSVRELMQPITKGKGDNLNDISMEFSETPSPTRGTYSGAVTSPTTGKKNLKMIGVLIDLKLSIEKVDERQQIILSEDGLLYKIDVPQSMCDNASLELMSQYNDTNQSVMQNSSVFGSNNMGHSGGQAKAGISSPPADAAKGAPRGSAVVDTASVFVLQTSTMAAQPQDANVQIFEIKMLPMPQQEERKKSSVGIDRVKDVALTRNGLVYVTEKGEAHIAVSGPAGHKLISEDGETGKEDTFMRALSDVFVGHPVQYPINENAILIRQEGVYDEQERPDSLNSPRDKSPDNKLLGRLSRSEVNAGEEYGTYRVPPRNHAALQQQAISVINEESSQREHETGSVYRTYQPGEPYFSEYDYPLMSIPVRQIQSTYISKVACGLEHALLLTSSAFVYSMGCNSRGQLGQETQNEQQSSLPLSCQGADQEVHAPKMIFALLNMKVTDIACGDYHSVAVGTARSSTAALAMQTSSNAGGGYSIGTGTSNYLQGHGASTGFGFGGGAAGNQRIGSGAPSRSQPLVFTWGCNRNHQLGLHQQDQQHADQIEAVFEPTLVEELLQYTHVRKLHAWKDRTMVLVDSPNTLITFTRQTSAHSSSTLAIEPADGQFITDFRAVPTLNGQTAILYSTISQIFLYTASDGKHEPLVQSCDKCLIPDHYLKQIVYLDDVDRLFAVSALKPQSSNQQMQQAGVSVYATAAPNIGHRPYPFHQMDVESSTGGAELRINEPVTPPPVSNDPGLLPQMMRAFGVNQGGDRPSLDQGDTQGYQIAGMLPRTPQAAPRTIGSVFSQEWRDLMKFIALSNGSTKVPHGIEPNSYRPQNLPKKTEEETARTNALVEENRRQYMEKQRAKKVEAEKRMAKEIEKEESLAGIWEREILLDWDNLKSTARVRELWVEGIPKRIRSVVWYRAIGNKSVVTKDLFNIMAERGRKLSELLKKHQQIENQICENGGSPADVERKIQALKQSQAGSGDQQSSARQGTRASGQDSELLEECYLKYYKIRKKLLMLIQIDSPSYAVQQREKSISLIEQDIRRTFAELSLFQEGMLYHDSLYRILQAFAMFRPDIGYVQGMSYLAGIVLLYVRDEYKSFMNFSNLMLKYPIMPFYTFNEEFVTKVLQLYKQLFQINLPDLCDHFEMEEIKPRQYVYKWVMTLFSTSLPLKIVSRVWDLYFLDGIFILYQTTIAILRLLRPKLLQEDMEGILHILQNVQQHIKEDDEDKLVDSIFNMVYPQWVYEEIPKLEINHLQQIDTADNRVPQ